MAAYSQILCAGNLRVLIIQELKDLMLEMKTGCSLDEILERWEKVNKLTDLLFIMEQSAPIKTEWGIYSPN
jgi:hypothetical protein